MVEVIEKIGEEKEDKITPEGVDNLLKKLNRELIQLIFLDEPVDWAEEETCDILLRNIRHSILLIMKVVSREIKLVDSKTGEKTKITKQETKRKIRIITQKAKLRHYKADEIFFKFSDVIIERLCDLGESAQAFIQKNDPQEVSEDIAMKLINFTKITQNLPKEIFPKYVHKEHKYEPRKTPSHNLR